MPARRLDLTHRTFVPGVLLVLALIGSSCGFGERKAQAEHLLRTPARIAAVDTARAKLTVATVPKLTSALAEDVPEELRSQFGGSRGTTTTVLAAVDFDDRRSQLSPAEAPDARLAVYTADALYLRRGGATRRPWVALDFSEVDARENSDQNAPLGFIAISPLAVVELFAGALSGSVKRSGQETIGSVDVTQFEMNIDWEKAVVTSDQAREFAGLEKLTEDQREALQRMYEAMSIAEPIMAGKAWLDAEGLPRKLEVVLEQRLILPGQEQRRRNRVEMTVTLEFLEFNTPMDIELPAKDETVFVEGFAQLVREARDRAAPTRQISPNLGGGQLPDGVAPPPDGQADEQDLPPDLPPDVRARLGR